MRGTVGADTGSHHRQGVFGVFWVSKGGGAHIFARGIIKNLIDRDLRCQLVEQLVLKCINLLQRHGLFPLESHI